MNGWQDLFRIALSVIDQANASVGDAIDWTFGGGTALMLQIAHRTSYDVDIFIDDPQLLPLLNPETQGYECEIRPSGYNGDGNGFLKIAFEDIGEIDFIVGMLLTAEPFREAVVEGRTVKLETVAEIIAKKIFYRGGNIKPRDIFDLAAAAQDHRNEIMEALRRYPDHVVAALRRLEKLNPEFIDKTISELAISKKFCDFAGTARESAVETLEIVAKRS
jgi:hypothetical protein